MVKLGKGLLIEIVYGTGEGSTRKSAFDDALRACGIHNYNILLLSSVIPEGSRVSVAEDGQRLTHFYEWGHRLYVVMAKMEQEVAGNLAVAGLGWMQGEAGKGLIIEHTGFDEKEVEYLIKISLDEMMERRKISGEINYKVVSIKCENKPVSAVVAAVTRTEKLFMEHLIKENICLMPMFKS